MSLQPVQNIERQQPDLALAYAQLAPLVTEAHAYYDSGRLDKCEAALRMARNLIDSVGPSWVLSIPAMPTEEGPKFSIGQHVKILDRSSHRMRGSIGNVTTDWGDGTYSVKIPDRSDEYLVRERELEPAPTFEIGSRVRIINRAHGLFGCFGRTMKRLLFSLLLLTGCNVQWIPVDPIQPDPNPPGPVVTSDEFRLLIVEETADRPKLPAGQQGIFTSTVLRKWLKEHCKPLSDGSNGFRIVDDDDFENLPGEFKGLETPKSVPWLYVTNGTTGLSCPLPTTADELILKVGPYASGEGGK